MTLQDLGNIGEFVAAIATLATLIYLALQIRQNTRSVRSASNQAWAAAAVATNMLPPQNPDFAPINRTGTLDATQLDPDELSQYVLYTLQIFMNYESLYLQSRNGTVDTQYWSAKAEGLRVILSMPGAAYVWNGAGRIFLDPGFARKSRNMYLTGPPPNKALQLTGHNAFQSAFGSVRH